MATVHEFHLPIRTEAHLKKFVWLAWGVTIPDVQVCEDHSTPWRAFCDAFFARAPVVVWEASRGFGGKTFLLSLLGITEAATLKADVNILGGSGEQSENVHRYMRGFWGKEDLRLLLGEEPLASDPSKRESRLVWGNTIKALMASQRSVRGPHPQRLRLDEVDEMALPIFDAAMGQPMSAPGIPAQTVISSTHQYADGTMTEVLKRAAEKGWPVHRWCYRETSEANPTGWLSLRDIEEKRASVTAAMWLTEYELQEPSPENRAIQPECVAAMFQPALGRYKGGNGEYIEAEPPMLVCDGCGEETPVDRAQAGDGCSVPGCKGELQPARYATGADWAKERDWTVIVTFRADVTPARVVAFERLGRRPWPQMVARFNQRLMRYGGSAAHDGTGLGNVVDDLLERQARPVQMIGRPRSDMLSSYCAAVERGEMMSPDIDFMHSEHRYASVDDVYRTGHLPDSIAAAALAWWAATEGRRQYVW